MRLTGKREDMRNVVLNRWLLMTLVLVPMLASCSGGTKQESSATVQTVRTYSLSENFPSWDSIQRHFMSSDGEWLVCYLDRDDHKRVEIVSVPTIGASPVSLYYSDSTETSIYWFDITPDGQYVIIGILIGFGEGVDLFSVPMEGGELVRLNEEPMLYYNTPHSRSYYTISEDSQWVLYPATGTEDLRVVSVTGGPTTSLSGRLGSNSLSYLSFDIMPDSRYVVYKAAYEGSDSALYRVPIEGGEPVRLTHEVIDMPYPYYGLRSFTGDGSLLVYAYWGQDAKYHVGVVPVAGGQTTPLMDSSEIPFFSISPDDRFIMGLFPVTDGGPNDLLAIPLNGGQVLNLTAGLEAAGTIDSWLGTPDGRYAVIKTDNEGQGYGLYRVSAEGERAVPLVTSLPGEATVRVVSVSPDSRYVLYSSAPDTLATPDLFSVPLSGGSPEYLCTSAQSLISPDSQLVLCQSGSVVPIAGGPPLDITGQDLTISWDANRRPAFMYHAKDKRLIWSSGTNLSAQGAGLFVSTLEEKMDE